MQKIQQYSIPVRATLTTRAAVVTSEIQIPDGGYRVIDYKALVYADAGFTLYATADRDLVTVGIRLIHGNVNYTSDPVEIFTLDRMRENRLWSGDWFPGGYRITFSFTVDADPEAATLPLTVGFDLVGLIGSEAETFNAVRGQVFSTPAKAQ